MYDLEMLKHTCNRKVVEGGGVKNLEKTIFFPY